MMQKWHNCIFILLTCSLLSCKRQFESLANFKINYEQEVTIESTGGLNLPFNLNTPPVTTNTENEFRNQNTRSNLIDEVNLNELRLEITSPTGADFSFLERIRIFIKADGLDDLEVAWKDPVPNEAQSIISLDCTDRDLQNYLKKEAFSLQVRATTDETISQDHEVTIYSEFQVKGKLFN
jgi:hypothetical protein